MIKKIFHGKIVKLSLIGIRKNKSNQSKLIHSINNQINHHHQVKQNNH